MIKDFDQKTKDLAYVIRSDEGWNIPERSTVMLVYPPSADFFIAFVACLRANVIPVPVFPPDPTKLKTHMYLFSSVQESSKAEVCLTNTDYNYAKKLAGLKSFFSSSGAKWPDVRWIITDNELPAISEKSKNEINLDSATSEDIAFLQYTSGSTSAPKGVIVKHKNLSHNINTIVSSLEAGDDTVVVSWLPQYHDMGLIGSFLSCIFCGGSGYYMSPITFIKNPPLWLNLMSKYKATHIQGPNFAYLLTARKLTQNNLNLDLSSLKHMFNAAEPITELAINRFLEVTEKYGVKPSAMKPGYGLAEHVVYVCDGGEQRIKVNKNVLETTNRVEIIINGENDKDKEGNEIPYTLLIGCGKPSKNPSIDLKIVDINQLQPLGEDEVGEIWINSPSKADGYYNLEELSKEDFHAKLNVKDSSEYLRTGDLGFIHKEELFICGRKKDLIIIRGRNHYPQDLEHTIENNGNIRGGCVAAFSIEDDGEESLIIVAEIKDDVKDVKSLSIQLLSSISQEHGISCDDIVLIPPRTISKTTSGKISRNKCKQDYLEKKMKILISTKNSNNNSTSPPTVCNESPTAICDNGSAKIHPQAETNISAMNTDEIYVEYIKDLKNVLQNPISNVNDTFLALGVDSLSLTQFSALIEDKYKVDVDNEMLFSETCTPIKIYEYLLVNLGFENSDIENSVKRYSAGLPPPTAGTGSGGNKGFKKSKRETFCPFCPCCW